MVPASREWFSAVVVVTSLRWHVVMRQNTRKLYTYFCVIQESFFSAWWSKMPSQKEIWKGYFDISVLIEQENVFLAKGDWVKGTITSYIVLSGYIWPLLTVSFVLVCIKEEQIGYTSRITKGLDGWLIRAFFECGTVKWKSWLGCQPKQRSLLFD